MNGGWIFLILLILFGLLGAGGWFAYTKYYKPRRANAGSNFNYPSPAPNGIADKLKDVWNRLRNPKTQTGAGYEATGGYGGARRGGGALDQDEEAWDSHVGGEADVYGSRSGGPGGGGYYEEQELGQQQGTEYRGAGGFRQAETLGTPGLGVGDRGRSKSPAKSNPFGDDNAASMRSVSPRPHVETRGSNSGGAGGKGSAESSPTFERRSIFREEV